MESRVIDTLERNEIGYIKIDYNETAGFGADGGGSHGEAIRGHVLGVYRFLERLRERLPDLVIENCSAGGHRLEPSMLGRSAMSSFSDAHECLEIPIIAANLHRLILPRQSQIWAVLHSAEREDLWPAVVHRFEDCAGPIEIPIHTGRERGGPTRIVGSLVEPSVLATLSDNKGETTLRVERLQAFSAAVVVLGR